ncbi:MAG TPA: antitoxin family protein [Gemmataceae bacterium]|jgi:predicted DNA-binding antitoxin AbrB/MazE fold protein|nr:antitoxin family protein [Gemmataceae bacterium]
MTMTVRAVYLNGMLRPDRPLALAQGETVDVTLATATQGPELIADDEITARLEGASTIAEWLEATKLLPDDDGGYDILAALNENRIWSGERPLIPADGPTQ